MYKRVATASPERRWLDSMLERLLRWWQGKLLVLCLIGFMATGSSLHHPFGSRRHRAFTKTRSQLSGPEQKCP